VARYLSFLCLALLAAAPASSFPTNQKEQSPVERLVPGKPLGRKIAGGQSHLYEIQLKSDECVRITIDQRGIDLFATLLDPAGVQLNKINNRHGERGTERALLLANVPGVYHVRVDPVYPNDHPGNYQISIDEPDSITSSDQLAFTAERVLGEANALRSQSLSAALNKYREALALFDATGDLLMKAVVLNAIGRTQFSLGDYPKAIESQEQALPLARAAGDQHEEATILNSLGQAHTLNSENRKSLSYLLGEVETLNVLGRVYSVIGDQYSALFYLDQALELSRALFDQNQELSALGGIALTYYVMGENEKAIENWKQALDLTKSTNRPGMEVVILGKLGAAYDASGDKQEALNYLNRALEMARARADRLEEAGTLQTMARVFRSTGEPRKSITYLDQSLVILKSANNPPGVARAHYNLGKAYTDLGEYAQAIGYLNLALEVWKTRDDAVNIAVTIRELARAERGRGNFETALNQTEAALHVIERVRAQAGGSELRASYLASVQNVFELRVDVLTQLHKRDPTKGYDAAALQTSEQARARTLLESLAEAGVDIRRGVPAELLERERTIAEALGARAAEQARDAGGKSSPEINREIKKLSAEYDLVQGQIRAASPHYAQLMQPQPLNLAEIRERVIDDQTVLLEYFLGQERSYLWAVTTKSFSSYELPKREVIEAAARRIHELLTARNRRVRFETVDERRARIAAADADFPAAAQALSRLVLAPVAGHLAKRRVLIVSDGALQYVPFAALPAPGSFREPLIVTNEVVSLPSASTLAVLRKEVATHRPPAKTIAVIADPVFNQDDQRVKDSIARNNLGPKNVIASSRTPAVFKRELQGSASESGGDGEGLEIPRLPFTRREAEAIAALVPAKDRRQQLDFAANLLNATSSDLAEYRIVHFATHGFLNSRHPELSGLVLSLVDENGRDQNGFLRAHEIYDLNLPSELVVLSGCRTGLGKEIKGEGLIGLTRAFMHAGAARVMVSLWDVHDEATAELMTRFYSQLLGPQKLSAAAALRAAQVSMISDRRWSAPYFWATFTLQGEPR
jgi:CHAT domain-containing protein